jgi:predicted DNA binding CopG/RHH family protein
MKKNRKVIIRINESQLEKIIAEAKKNEVNKSTLLREVLDDHFKQISSENVTSKFIPKKDNNQ